MDSESPLPYVSERHSVSTRKSIRVFLVDDQAIIGEAVRRYLAPYDDIEYSYCSNPLEALQRATEQQPTVILQDLVMPDIDGLELVQFFRNHSATARIPILVLSTKEDAQIKSQAFAAGANDYLVKLPDKVELIARLRYHSQAYIHQIQRDHAYRALRESQQQLLANHRALISLHEQMEEANRKLAEANASLAEANARLESLATTDSLTGLKNHRAFQEALIEEFARSASAGLALSVLLLDVDHFKLFNDTFGHPAGDQVLSKVGETLRNTVRSTDFAARYGGEEFVLLLRDTGKRGALEMAERVRGAIASLHWEQRNITVSIGVTSLEHGHTIPSELTSEADKALYVSKSRGRNCVTYYEPYQQAEA